MTRYLALLLFAVTAVAEERPLPNPEILKWQAEAQQREQTINRRAEDQLRKTPKKSPAPKPLKNPSAARV